MPCLRAAGIVARARFAGRAGLVMVLVAGIAVAVPGRVVAATSTTLFVQSFANNTVDPAYPMSVPGLPGGASGSNAACLTASGNTTSGVLRSCPNNNDPNGSGNLRLTTNDKNQEGGAFGAVSVPTLNGIDATFTTYQYGTPPLFSNPADGLAFVLAAVDPASPVPPAVIGQPGGSLGYSAYLPNSPGPSNPNAPGLANGYLGIGFDVYGNFSNIQYQGTGCPANPPYIGTGTTKVPGQVVVRGPGSNQTGYCPLNSTATNTSSSPVSLRNNSRGSAAVPVEVVINPTAGSFTTASGLVVPAGQYAVRFTPAGGSARTLSGPLPAVPAGLYPSSSWTTAAGIPKQLAFGWVGSTGASVDFHEVDAANVVSFNPVPQLTVSQAAYSVASPAPGAPVTYTVSAGVSSSAANEGQPISVTQALPAGVTPAGAYGTGWTCAPMSGQTITCTYSTTPVNAGTTLPPIIVNGIVTASGMTAATIQSGTTATASSADGNPAYASSAAAGTLPAVPSGVTLSPASGPIAGGTAVTISGSNISGPGTATVTAIEIGTTAQQQAGTPTVLLPCSPPSSAAPGCFTVNGGVLSISSMPSVPASTTVNVTVVTYGVAGAPAYTYTAAPAAPAAPAATAGAASATVSWSAPASNGSPITGYVVTPYLNGVAQAPQSFDASTTTRTITGLTVGSSYTFTVAAVNAAGTGPASPQSNAVVPYTVPGAPTIGTVSAANSAATVSWTAPASNGGSPITGYVVTPYINGVAQPSQTFNSTATTQLVSGLTPGTSYTFKVAAVNAAGTGPASAASAAVTVNMGPSLTFSPPPPGEITVPYSYSLTASGGTGALTWSVSAGSLPPGLSVNPGTGLLSGTPTASGSYSFTVKVTDTLGATNSKAATVVIAAAPALANPAPPSAQAAVAYSDPLTVTGGTGPFTWVVSSGSLPPGLSLSSATGAVSGTPATVGLYSFTVKVTDSFGLTATQALNITVAVGPLAISATAGSSPVPQGGTLGYTITITNTAATAYSGVTFSVPLASVLSGATYNNDAAASSGTVTYASPSLTWTGDLAAGSSATITFSVTVASPYTGGGTLSFTVTSATVGTNCYSGSTDPKCTVSVPVSALSIATTTDVPAAAPGTVVHYTITVTNSGSVAYPGATFTDPLTAILDDASYNNNAAATSGTVSYASPNLTWTGSLAAGATATITFSVTVASPDTGDKVLASTITSATTGSNCPAGSTDARCTAVVPVEILAITATADTASATPGTVVHYTVTVTNSGTANYAGATFTDALGGVLDDATYNGNAAATTGVVTFASPNLTWTGNLAAGDTATITFTATVNSPDAGDKVLATTITSSTAGSNCPSGGTDPACATSVTVLIPGLTISNAVSPSTPVPGLPVTYTLTIKNSGQTGYTGITVTDSLAGTLDDATYTSASASTGTVSYAAGVVTWTGDVPLSGTVTVTISVTVNSPDTGDKVLVAAAASAAAGSTCPTGTTTSPCRITTPVLTPVLAVTATADAASAVAGGTVHYTVTITDAGQIPYTNITVSDDLTGLLDDATYNGDAAITAGPGTVGFTSPNLTWTGSLTPGDAVTITFSATVNSPDAGDMTLKTAATSGALGSTCPLTGGSDPRCATTVTVSQLTLTNTADVATTTPGSVVRFTTAFTNTGQTPYTGITIGTVSTVLDNAVANGDQVASSGTIAITGAGATWTGDIPVGGTVTVTGTVTVKDPLPAGQSLTSTLTTTAPGSNCPSGGTDPRCTATVPVLIPGLAMSNAASPSTPVPGSVVGYTLTITNTGQAAYTGIMVTDSLAGTLDDAVYNNDATVTAGGGTVSYDSASSAVTWTGDIPVGGTVTVTFSVTVNTSDTGDKVLIVSAATTAAGASCATGRGVTPIGSTITQCRSTIAVLTPALTIATSTSTATAVGGDKVSYTITITNSGQTPYSGITVADDLSGVVSNATYNNDATVTAGGGTVSYDSASHVLTWTGSLNPAIPSPPTPAGTVTITFSATVSLSASGGAVLAAVATSTAAGSNCPPGSPDPRCSTTVSVASATLLTISLSSGGVTSAVAGGTVNYTMTITNAAATAYTGITVSDDLTGLLDDATYNGDATATAGTATFTSPNLTWTGDVAANGGTVTVTFSVTVHSPDTGNKVLTMAATSGAPNDNCPLAGGSDPRCASTVTVSQLAITNVADVGTTTPGGVVQFTTTFTNTGQTPYTGITIATDASNVFDDAVPNGDQTATSGTIVIGAGGVVTWTGNIPVGGTVTVTGHVTVTTPDTGNKVMTSTVTTGAAGSNCPTASPAPACTVTVNVLIPGLTISNAESPSTPIPTSPVTYTLTIANSGQTAYTGITVTDSLAGTLDDAVYNNDATVTGGGGTVSYASPVVTWTGDIPVGATVTVTFSVTVNNPDAGDKVLIASATSAAAGSTCPTGATASPCRVTTPVLTPVLAITTTADAASAAPGGTVHYTVTITDAGQVPYPNITVSDDLTGLLDDATYNNDAAVTAGPGSVGFTSPNLTWTGSLNPANPSGTPPTPADTVTITFSATVKSPDPGNKVLTTAATSGALGSNCPLSGGSDPRCATTVTVSQLTITNASDVATTTPGSVVRFTTTFTNTGQTPYTGITIATDARNVFDDAVPNGDQTATSGTVVITGAGTVSWTGDIPVGGTVTITGHVTVLSPDTGNKLMTSTLTTTAAGSNCPAGSTDPACTVSVPVLIPALTITKTADVATTTPGSVVHYAITVADTGPTPYTGATVTDDVADALNDAVYNGDLAATTGTLSYANFVLSWTGNLAPGDTATITYSLTVDNPDTGDKHLVNTVASSDPGSTCPPGSTSPACTSTVTDLIPGLTITNTPSVATTTPGSTVQYTVTVDNTGQTSYSDATVTDDLTGALGSAAYNGDATADIGTVSFARPVLTWTSLAAFNPGDVATITYSVTVSNPETGPPTMTNTAISDAAGSNCQAGGSPTQCTATVGIIRGPLSMASVPAAVDLGHGLVGGTIQGSLGPVQVSDDRGFGEDWTASVSSTNLIAGSLPAQTIPAGNEAYDISGFTSTSGNATFQFIPSVDLSGDPQAVVSATNVGGNNSATWDPVISVAVPAGAIVGTYSGTIIHSVS
jgi:uncharacterized repeat protein (TIGR01451 family)